MPDYEAPADWVTTTGGTARLAAHPARLRVRVRGADRHRGGRRWRSRIQDARGAQRPNRDRASWARLFAVIFLGISFLVGQLGVLPDPTEQQTVISQVTRTLVGSGPFFLLVQIATAVVLLLAANTSFADFPRLSSFLARDGFMPRVLPVPRRPAGLQLGHPAADVASPSCCSLPSVAASAP